MSMGKAIAMGGNSTLCELQVQVHPSHCVSLESVQFHGCFVSFDAEGHPIDGKTGYSRHSREFGV
ncbi:hypothetical protein JZ751_004011, partial [Albula glossodonta]